MVAKRRGRSKEGRGRGSELFQDQQGKLGNNEQTERGERNLSGKEGREGLKQTKRTGGA